MEDATVEVQLAVINAKLDVLIQQRADHETRLRALEQAKWRWAGLASGAGLVSGLLAPLVHG